MTKFSHFAADLGTTAEDLQEQLAQEAKRKGFTPPRPKAAVPMNYRDDFKPYRAHDRVVCCGARCRDGHPCRAPGIGHGNRCKLHGGKSTGPKTEEGRQRAIDALERYRASQSKGGAK